MAQEQKTIEKSIKIGSRAMVELEGGMRINVTIGDRYDESSSEVVVSYLSPIGSALLGKKQGETVTYTVEGKTLHAQVVEIVT